MKPRSAKLVGILAVALLSHAARGDDLSKNAKTEAELERMTNEMLAAIAPGRVEVWKRYADDRLIYVSEANEVMTLAQLLDGMKPLPKGLSGQLKAGEFKMELYGNVAVTTFVANESLDYHGQVIQNDFRQTATWLKKEAGWRMIGAQVLAVLEDPPAIALSHETLCGYNGTYQLAPEIVTKVTCTDAGLSSERSGGRVVTMKAEVRDVFFTPGQPRSRRIFLRNERGDVIAFVDRREGLDIRWAKIE